MKPCLRIVWRSTRRRGPTPELTPDRAQADQVITRVVQEYFD